MIQTCVGKIVCVCMYVSEMYIQGNDKVYWFGYFDL